MAMEQCSHFLQHCVRFFLSVYFRESRPESDGFPLGFIRSKVATVIK